MHSATRVGSLDQYFDINEPWQFTVLRSQNMAMLRPEKSWRPIITLELDGQHKHEVMLGVDGQNPNQRDVMLLHHVHHQTQIKLDVWHKSQSKAKSRKRRHLVASTSMALGDAIKRQGTEPYVVFHLSSVPSIPAMRKKSIAQKSRPCASLLVRLRPPRSVVPFLVEDDRLSSASSVGDSDLSDTFVTSGTDGCEDPLPWSSPISEEPPYGLRRRKKVKGFRIDSEEECSGESDSHDESYDMYPDSPNTNAPSTISVIFPSLFPTSYVSDIISVASVMSYASSTFDTLTYHRELHEAQATQLDSNFDQIHRKLVQEWYYIGASLFSIVAVDTTVFGFSSSSLFNVDSIAKRALIISAVASALGLFVDVCFVFVYSGADVRNFQTLAVDLYGSYFFFALSSRLPLVALFVAVLALAVFLGAIAWTAWPAAVLVMCVLAGILVSLQFIVYGSHRLALGLACMVRDAWLGVLYASRRVRAVFVRGAAAAVQGEHQVGPLTVPPRQVVAPPVSVRVSGPARNPV
ncbi:hypothetical protein EDB87DRAFT_1155664 [Lactarius vividus]|nr:hypothetical protein EDB87DRAFT_1155664 [Lactarius vividus]